MDIEDSALGNEDAAQATYAGEALRNQELGEFAYALVTLRQNVSPRRLFAPAPNADQLLRILEAAAAAPDHGMIVPWRFVIVPDDARELLGEAFAAALVDRDPQATDAELAAAREKARRAPLLMLAIVRLAAAADAIPDFDRLISVGCAIQNMLVTVHSLGYGAGLTSGRALRSPRLRDLFRLAENEHAVCFINIGTVSKRKPLRARPPVAAFTSTLQATSQA
jgi:nitroreductase